MATSIDKVKEILETGLEDANITAYITTATLYVDQILSGKGLSSEVMDEIYTYVTAHLITHTKERQGAEEEAGTAKIKYTGTYGMGLKATTYGQTAILLDTTGCLAKAGKPVASIKAIGTDYVGDINTLNS